MAETAGPVTERASVDADIVCVGFGPAAGGFLSTLARQMAEHPEDPAFQSKAAPGMPLQVLCYERADDLGYGVSGVVTRGRAIKASLSGVDLGQLPLYAPISGEEVLYLLDPHGASRRSAAVRAQDALLRLLPGVRRAQSVGLPYIPPFLHKKDGFVVGLGQFNQWMGSLVMATGAAQVWPGSPVAQALIEGERVAGVRLVDQGVDALGRPQEGYLPGMDVRAALTVVADGPVGPVGRQLDEHFGMPQGHHKHDWAVGMKAVLDLPPDCGLKPGHVIHTMGYPEPEIFGFLYVYPGNVATAGIFVPSWFDSPSRTAYRYLQHWMRHPRLWRHLSGSRLRSWGAKSLAESGQMGEPQLCGDGYARIGEGSGSTNVLTGSGVDEAWATGVQLADGVVELLRQGRPFDRAGLEQAYVARRRASWVEREGRAAAHARDGFHAGFIQGALGMALAGFTGGRLHWPAQPRPTHARLPQTQDYYKPVVSPAELAELRRQSEATGAGLHDALMDRQGWPAVELDGQLLVSQQDALLMGGKVQAAAGFADHVRVLQPELCKLCGEKICVDLCSGQALTVGEDGVPAFDREKCVHCGVCLWNCRELVDPRLGRTNILFMAGAGGLHSAEN
jgi:electron-transferring-flavoprotein dehydrogenase